MSTGFSTLASRASCKGKDTAGLIALSVYSAHELAADPLPFRFKEPTGLFWTLVPVLRLHAAVSGGLDMNQQRINVNGDREDGKLTVHFDYNTTLIGLVKQIEGRSYDPKRKEWLCPRSQLGNLVHLFEKEEVEIVYKGASLQQEHYDGLVRLLLLQISTHANLHVNNGARMPNF